MSAVPASTQALVVGGGPAGSTAATLLAREGVDVLLLERDRFPRYHVGESILPSCLPIFDLTGVREKVEAHGFVRKGGAYFEWGPENWELNFDHLQGTDTYSFQVIRSEFDKLLLDHARTQGVEVVEGASVRDVEFDGERAVAARWSLTDDWDTSGAVGFDHVIDASGRSGVLATRHLRNRRFNESFRNVAVWGYWEGARRLDRGPENAIAVCSVPNGWFWSIPLHDGTTSVGLVTGKERFGEQREVCGGVEEAYLAAMQDAPRVLHLLEDATRVGRMHVEQDYSYVAEQFSGPGYLLSGDAACFLDPLLSTGVHLATFSGLLAAAAVVSTRRGEVAEQDALRFYDRAYRQAYERLLILVSLFYRSYRREAQFFEAEKLTRRERNMLRLYESFLHVVSGVEDIQDAKDSALDAVAAKLASSGQLFAGHNEAMDAMPASPEHSVAGLYLAFEPRLGLRALHAGDPVP